MKRVQDATEKLADIELSLSDINRQLEELRQQIRHVAALMKPNLETKIEGNEREEHKKTASKRRNPYGSSFRPDRWMETPNNVEVTSGLQETWTVGDLGGMYPYPSESYSLDMSSLQNYARQSEHSIHARP